MFSFLRKSKKIEEMQTRIDRLERLVYAIGMNDALIDIDDVEFWFDLGYVSYNVFNQRAATAASKVIHDPKNSKRAKVAAGKCMTQR